MTLVQQLALDLRDERNDRWVRLVEIRDRLQSRLDKVKEAIDELDWMSTTSRRLQKKIYDTESIEAMRDEYRRMADDPQDLVSPPHYFTGMADLCDAVLAERGATCVP